MPDVALDNSDVAYGRIQPTGYAERYIASAENLPNNTGKTAMEFHTI